MSLSRRTLLARSASLLALPLVGGVAACSASGDQSGTSAASAEPSTSGSAGPVTITHQFGETVVPAGVQRVATVGWSDQDFVLPYGIVPVIARPWFDEYDSYPWVQEAPAGRAYRSSPATRSTTRRWRPPLRR